MSRQNEENLIYEKDGIKTYMFLEAGEEAKESGFSQEETPGEAGYEQFNKVNFWNGSSSIANPRVEALLEEIKNHLQAIEKTLAKMRKKGNVP